MPNESVGVVERVGDMFDDGGFAGQELMTGREVKCLSRRFGGGVLPVVLGVLGGQRTRRAQRGQVDWRAARTRTPQLKRGTDQQSRSNRA